MHPRRRWCWHPPSSSFFFSLIPFLFLSPPSSSAVPHSSFSLSSAPANAPFSATLPLSSPSPGPRQSQTNGTLDPSQSRALSSLGVSPGPDPCSASVASDPSLLCDASYPFKRLLYLRLQYCADDQKLPPSAWKSLAPSLTGLSFIDCPAPPPELPPELTRSLASLEVVASLGRSVENAMAPGLKASWLSRFNGLHQLKVQEVEVSGGGRVAATVSAIIANMTSLQLLVIASANLSGDLPSSWPSLDLETLHISGNDLRGVIPPSIGRLGRLISLDLSAANLIGVVPPSLANLTFLRRLDLSDNRLSGPLPPPIRRCAALQYLDLSSNHLSGPVPSFLAHMPSLRYLDLSNNRFSGVLPFNDAFIRSLNAFKAGGNADLCFNASSASAKFVRGLQPCDSSGRPSVQPPVFGGPAPAPSPEALKEEVPTPVSGRRGPSRIVLVVAIALASIVAVIVMLVVLSRCCWAKQA